jgi:hypothetical protein
MKKIAFLLVSALCAAVVFAQEFKVNGEVKTGILWNKFENQLDLPNEMTEAGSKDDAGSGAGRFRLNAEYFNPNINIGFKFRINWENWQDKSPSGQPYPGWPYAFGYAKLFDNQLTMSLGKLGASPWGTGGPEMWKELEAVDITGGMRFEYEPFYVPGLNVGFVLNGLNSATDVWNTPADPITFFHILAETVVGVSYTHDYFHVRTAVRFDSEVDGVRGRADGKQGADLVYRMEERILTTLLSGFKIWAMGYMYGIGASEGNKADFSTWNWLFAEYAPDLFIAQIRFGYDAVPDLNTLYIKPSFYLTPFNKLIKVGASFEYKKDFGNLDDYKASAFRQIEVRPLAQVNISPNAYVAFEYSFRREYVKYVGTDYQVRGLEPLIQNQWINLRFGVTF